MTRWHGPPAELYAEVERTPGTVLLESARPAEAETSSGQPPPPTRLFIDPLRVCVANQLDELPGLFAEIERAVASGHFAAGYFAYECGGFFEPTASSGTGSAQSSGQPLAWFGIYPRPYLFDHRAGAFLEGDSPSLAQFQTAAVRESSREAKLVCALTLAEEEYAQRIAEIHAWIRSGDVYQLNFTVPIQVNVTGSVASLYQQLRSLQPAPYGAFLHTQSNHRILSFSPELFFRLESSAETRRITTRPMKGTAPRGRTTGEDRVLADWLRNDPKNRAENVMIVDLLRNDLGRLCSFGSVRAGNLFALERYPTLWQMTSTIEGELRHEIGFQDIFRALFPCGSITGAPKIRAMQLVAQLEGRSRGVYTGAIGFFSKHESIFNVAIRTLSLQGDKGTMGVGSGIVIDSKPDDEFRECLLKAKFLTRPANSSSQPSPESFSLVETLLWRGEFPFIEMHLDRLQDSAHYFAFPFDRLQTKAALQAHGAELTGNLGAPGLDSETWETAEKEEGETPVPLDRHSHKVRLLLNHDGSLRVTSEPIPASSTELLRVRFAAHPIDSHDPMYFHKTTSRPLYAEALNAATAAGYDDALFLNERGEVTEGAIHNIFMEKDGRLLTPPVACGLLPGVHRRHILATHPNAEERILTREDLRQADAIYLSNAVRGLRAAIIDWQND
jgi:para-aminobenzoate synthetase/4-amino-4-deoxychorismate lyase